MDAGRFNILFVCTGNICRSPLAEQLFRARTVDLTAPIVASSAGTTVRVGEAMTREAANLSTAYGGDPSQHRASALSSKSVREANLVLALTRAHRAEVVSLVPRAHRTAFTLREFARLVWTTSELESERLEAIQATDVTGLDEFVKLVAAMRGFGKTLSSPADDDVIDPYRQGQGVYDEAGRLIDHAVETVAFAFKKVTTSGHRSGRDETSPTDTLGGGPASFRSATTGER